MSRRFVLGSLTSLAVLLAGCEIHIDHELVLRADGGGELTTTIVYDEAAAELLGPAEVLRDELERDVDGRFAGVSIVAASADGSDPAAHEASLTVAADDPAAVDALVADRFHGGFDGQEDEVYLLRLAAEDVTMEGDAEMAGIGGSMVIRHDGQRVELTGGSPVDAQTVSWDPFGTEDLLLAVDLAVEGTADTATGLLWLFIAVAVIGVFTVIALVVIIVRRSRAGGDSAPSAMPGMTGSTAQYIDAPQTPAASDEAHWTTHPPTTKRPVDGPKERAARRGRRQHDPSDPAADDAAGRGDQAAAPPPEHPGDTPDVGEESEYPRDTPEAGEEPDRRDPPPS